MRIKLNKAVHVYALPCEIEVTEAEAHRLIMLGCAEVKQVVKEIRKEEIKKETKKAGK
ncbi:MAG: hypothetical protein J6N95_05510 [Bacilli bacterium]|nr:hypothetical protein [Bacilli bacterium]